MGPKKKKAKVNVTPKRAATTEVAGKLPSIHSTDETDARSQVLSILSSRQTQSRQTTAELRVSHTEATSTSSEMSLDQDILLMVLPETTQKLVHCQIGQDLFVDKTWCTVKKSDILEDISIQDDNSPFFKIIHKIRAYKPEELLIGYEPFGREENQFYICITEAGRDDVLKKLQDMKAEYLRKIQASKGIKARPWESHGSETDVDLFKVKNSRAFISLEWIGEVAKRCNEPDFADCDPDSMKNGYTCLLPGKDQPELVFMKTQDTGAQAVPVITDLGVQTEPEIPTNACTQCDPETEIPGDEKSGTSVQPEDLNTFFDKYMNFLTDVLHYNEVYDLYYDDYPALVGESDDTQVHQYSAYRQYQAFTDVAAIEGKLVVSSSWHPNYTGIVAIAYANDIPCKMQELEYDSDQMDYEGDKSDESDGNKRKSDSDYEMKGAKEWLDEEKLVKDAKEENTDAFERAVKKLKDIESEKHVWESKIMGVVEEVRRKTSDIEEELLQPKYEYVKYREPESEPEPEPESEDKPDQIEIPIEDTTPDEPTEEAGEQEGDEDGRESILEQFWIKETDQEDEISQRRPSVTQSNTTDRSEMSDSFVSRQDKSIHKLSKHKQHRLSAVRPKRSKIGAQWRGTGREDSSLGMASSMLTTSSTTTGISSISDMSLTRSSCMEQEQYEEVTDDEEIKEAEEELPYLEPNNPVLIWSFVDDLIPKLRLDSPYEVTSVEFCPHNGNYIAGGTVSGQVVVWDITGRIEQLEKPEQLTTQQQKYRKMMEYLMDWRRDTRSKRRVRACAISSCEDSHNEKITSLSWTNPFLEISRLGDILTSPDFSRQVITTSLNGEIKVWDLKLNPFVKKKKQITHYKTKARFGRPESLDADLSPFSRLYRNWKPVVTFKVIENHLPVMLTGVGRAISILTRARVHSPDPTVKEALEDRIRYTVLAPTTGISKIPYVFFCSTAFGYPGNGKWEPLDEGTHVGGEGPVTTSVEWWNTLHDGPITRVSRHSFFPDICLTIGGHVFAIWHSQDKEYPIMSKRYHGVYITDGFWSDLRPSLIRIARSDGVVEIWDLLIQSHAPANQIVVSGKIITNMSAPILPEVHGLLGIADYNSAFRLFYIPRQFRMYTQPELERVSEFLHREPKRKIEMREWSKWWRENNINLDREEKREAEEKKKYEDEERLEKEKLEEARQKYNEEVYRWYMRRRGKPFLRQEEEEQKWRDKQEQLMHEVIMEKKKVDRAEMEVLMRPLVKERENEAQKLAKVKEKLKEADSIFRSTVDLIFPKKTKVKPVVQSEDDAFMEEVLKKVDQYFGDGFTDVAAEQLDIIERSPWQFDFEFSELMDKYNSLRMLFNDRRRKRNKTLRWLRKKLKEELLTDGFKLHVRKSHKERYAKKRIKRREENLEWLQNIYGEDYNIHWDRIHPCRRFADRKFRVTVDETSSDYYEIEEERSLGKGEENEDGLLSELGKMKSTLEIITDIGVSSATEEDLDIDTNVLLSQSQPSGSMQKAMMTSQETRMTVQFGEKARALGIIFRPSTATVDLQNFKPAAETSTATSEVLFSPMDSGLFSAKDLSFKSLQQTESASTEVQELNYITQHAPLLEPLPSQSTDVNRDVSQHESRESQIQQDIEVLPIASSVAQLEEDLEQQSTVDININVEDRSDQNGEQED